MRLRCFLPLTPKGFFFIDFDCRMVIGTRQADLPGFSHSHLPKRKKYPVSGSSLGEIASLTPERTGQSFETIKKTKERKKQQ